MGQDCTTAIEMRVLLPVLLPALSAAPPWPGLACAGEMGQGEEITMWNPGEHSVILQLFGEAGQTARCWPRRDNGYHGMFLTPTPVPTNGFD